MIIQAVFILVILYIAVKDFRDWVNDILKYTTTEEDVSTLSVKSASGDHQFVQLSTDDDVLSLDGVPLYTV